jgi:glycosyltransferase involved in cell wall biosynthesis
MNILLSAYSINPKSGSEPGVAWSFVRELVKEHTLYVVTRAKNKPALEEELATNDYQGRLHFYYFDVPIFSKMYKTASISEHLYYFIWQMGLLLGARKIFRRHPIDLVHHVTLGAFRIPSFLVFYNKPLIFGPVGGGETYPFSIKKSFPIKFILTELLRDLVNQLFVLNPFLLYTFSKSTLIVCRTKQTLNLIPKRFHYKCMIEIGIGAKENASVLPEPMADEAKATKSPLKILYAGRPLYWKGLHFVIAAFAQIRQQYSDVEFNVIGSGNNKWAKAVAARYGVLHTINWLGRVDNQKLEHLYRTSDMLTFPSLREAGGAVAVEALYYSLPVLCLDLGGPCQIVNNNWGMVIKTGNKTQAELVQDIAGKITDVYHSREKLISMKANSRKEIPEYSMNRIVERIYQNPLVIAALENDVYKNA